MPMKSYREAIRDALSLEMSRDESIVLIGEDLRGAHGCKNPQNLEAFGGPLGVTKGLSSQFGESRVIDTPISESAIIGMATGAAVTGLRPVAEMMFMDFFGVCYDGLYNQAAKFRYMFGGKAQVPLVVRGMIGAGFSAAAQHSQSPYNIFASTPGLKIVVPSTPYDAKGLLIQSIRDNDPVIFCEHKMLYDMKGDVPDESYSIPLGQACYTREGNDITIIALSAMVHLANKVADKLAIEGISVEVVDPRTISPLDEDGLLESVISTGRVVIVDESSARCGFAHDVAALIVSKAFYALKAPVVMVTPPHTPVPFSPALEKLWVPDTQRIEKAVRELMEA
ncbi:TPA: alpha-ketoacid dehydrogenase subunit beta [Salmonella enterica subsp. enterica serovar Eastbourne]|uniref:2-oxoisovalerate dehydrogenase subunit beta n=1 Tax=Salmonella enterica subsp. salamae TaxID=59202 RepID=A0A5Y3XFY9_SALER|nr:alpha-ketoacid dehydrogenase subunit beta [Salmonella enterica]EBK2702026.1 alpha-ketoacid dehydrogenase subunit beta [Salmonella enterica subsp. enterica serovar Paratyphi B]ECJ4508185.1 alpha-ketoacid dehydrogenase subunit beta [Salmonella enterica subsp. salamae]EDV4534720.1 alpha-ketoacid dehydrogenase subunit beta [Salmonella enterica subsp. enterica]HAK5294250.1 alpha-ketoacid dehydrogenase subunit beta [Salmonella enterica]